VDGVKEAAAVRDVLVVGASQAGLAASRELRRLGHDGPITILDAEEDGPYRRPEVSKGLLSGKFEPDTVAVRWPEDLGLDLVTGVTAERLDADRRVVTARRAGESIEFGYDGLVVATGAAARPVPLDAVPSGVHTLRTVADSLRMRAELDAAAAIVIVGAGFIGLEVAAVAAELGKRVTVVEAAPVPLERVLGRAFGEHVAAVHRTRGVELRTGTGMARLEVDADGAVSGVELTDGSRLSAALVLFAVGSVPETGWLEGSGATLENGVRCDATCEVEGLPGVVAAGDVASWWNPLYARRMRVEHWTNAIEQGGYAARRLLGEHDPAGFSSAPYFWSDQFGMRLQSIGSTTGHDAVEVIEHEGDTMIVGYGVGGRLVAVAGLNAGTAVNRYRKAVLTGADLESVRPEGREVA
jgi:NADPH-dependent 2,4-dienoyl-CoA reductase/sulfur reductase-like enzyme